MLQKYIIAETKRNQGMLQKPLAGRRYALGQDQKNLDTLFKKNPLGKAMDIRRLGSNYHEQEVVEEIFDLLDRRKHSSAMILTSNRDIDEWQQVFADQVIANATIDRIFDQADISIFKGTSYRLKGKI